MNDTPINRYSVIRDKHLIEFVGPPRLGRCDAKARWPEWACLHGQYHGGKSTSVITNKLYPSTFQNIIKHMSFMQSSFNDSKLKWLCMHFYYDQTTLHFYLYDLKSGIILDNPDTQVTFH